MKRQTKTQPSVRPKVGKMAFHGQMRAEDKKMAAIEID